jgi:hypothetical protein
MSWCTRLRPGGCTGRAKRLRINKAIGISEYRLAESLLEKLKGSLPTIEEPESELGLPPHGSPSEYRKR